MSKSPDPAYVERRVESLLIAGRSLQTNRVRVCAKVGPSGERAWIVSTIDPRTDPSSASWTSASTAARVFVGKVGPRRAMALVEASCAAEGDPRQLSLLLP